MPRPIVSVQPMGELHALSAPGGEAYRIGTMAVPDFQTRGGTYMADAFEDFGKVIHETQGEEAAAAWEKYVTEYEANKEEFRKGVESGKYPELANPAGRDFFYRLDSASVLNEVAVRVRARIPQATAATGEDGHLRDAVPYDDIFAEEWGKAEGSASFRTRAGSRVLAQVMPGMQASLRGEYTEARLASEKDAKKIAIGDRMATLASNLLNAQITAYVSGVPPAVGEAMAQEHFNFLVREASDVTPDTRSLVKESLRKALHSMPSGEAVMAALPLLKNLTFDRSGRPISSLAEMRTFVTEEAFNAVRRIEADNKLAKEQFTGSAADNAKKFTSTWISQIAKASPEAQPDIIAAARTALAELPEDYQVEASKEFAQALSVHHSTSEMERSAIYDRVQMMSSSGRPTREISDYIDAHRAELGRLNDEADAILAQRENGEKLLQSTRAMAAVSAVGKAITASRFASVNEARQESLDDMDTNIREYAMQLSRTGDKDAATKLGEFVKKQRDERIQQGNEYKARREQEIRDAYELARSKVDLIQDPKEELASIRDDFPPNVTVDIEDAYERRRAPLYFAFGNPSATQATVRKEAEEMLRKRRGTGNYSQDMVGAVETIFKTQFAPLAEKARKGTTLQLIQEGLEAASWTAMEKAVDTLEEGLADKAASTMAADTPQAVRYRTTAPWSTEDKEWDAGFSSWVAGAKTRSGRFSEFFDKVERHHKGDYGYSGDPAENLLSIRGRVILDMGKVASANDMEPKAKADIMADMLGTVGIPLRDALEGQTTVSYATESQFIRGGGHIAPYLVSERVPINVNPFVHIIDMQPGDAKAVAKALGYDEALAPKIVKAQQLRRQKLTQSEKPTSKPAEKPPDQK